MISWISKKQNTVALSNIEVEYRDMTATSQELALLKNLLSELRLRDLKIVKFVCDNQTTL